MKLEVYMYSAIEGLRQGNNDSIYQIDGSREGVIVIVFTRHWKLNWNWRYDKLGKNIKLLCASLGCSWCKCLIYLSYNIKLKISQIYQNIKIALTAERENNLFSQNMIYMSKILGKIHRKKTHHLRKKSSNFKQEVFNLIRAKKVQEELMGLKNFSENSFLESTHVQRVQLYGTKIKQKTSELQWFLSFSNAILTNAVFQASAKSVETNASASHWKSTLIKRNPFHKIRPSNIGSSSQQPPYSLPQCNGVGIMN